jgi:hypothetical protein
LKFGTQNLQDNISSADLYSDLHTETINWYDTVKRKRKENQVAFEGKKDWNGVT